MSDIKYLENPTIEKYCDFCSLSYSSNSGHWKVTRGEYLECKAKARETRRARSAKRNLETYGTEKPRQTKEFHQMVAEKRKTTMMEKYGVENPMHSKEMKERQVKSLFESTGVTVPSKSPTIMKKIQDTNMKRYGFITNLRQPEVVEKASVSKKDKFSILLSDGTRLRDLCDENKVSRAWAYKMFKYRGEEFLRKYITSYEVNVTSTELTFIDIMKNITELALYNKRPASGGVPYRPDFCIELAGKTLYINTDGLHWHCEDKEKDSKYHFKMRQAYEAAGLRVMQFRADELVGSPEIVRSMVMNYFGLNKRIGARECQVIEMSSSDATDFTELNHIMGSHPACKSYGLVYDGRVVACMGVRRRGQDLHIERFCNEVGLSVSGGFSKLLAHVTAVYSPQVIVSFCDLRYASGTSYIHAGFERVQETLGWCWTDKVNCFNRLHCRANMDSRGLSEAEHALEMKLFRLYDAGQAKYIKVLQKPADK